MLLGFQRIIYSMKYPILNILHAPETDTGRVLAPTNVLSGLIFSFINTILYIIIRKVNLDKIDKN